MKPAILESRKEQLRQKAQNIKNELIKEKIFHALDSIEDPLRNKIITDAVKTARKSRIPDHLRIALDLAEIANTLYPSNVFIISELALVLTFLKEPEKCIGKIENFFQKSTENNWSIPNRSREFLTVTLSHAYKSCGNTGKGISILEALNSNSPNVLEALAELFYLNEKPDKTIELLETYSPLTIKMALWLSRSYFQNGLAEQALDTLKPFKNNPTVKDYYQEILTEREVATNKEEDKKSNFSSYDANSIPIFISHASGDADVAKRFVSLLCAALNFNKSQIRCTSIAGSKLEIGADTSKSLAQDILGARIFIGLLTEQSVQSSYVLFELGASWIMSYTDSKLHTFPVLGHDVSYDFLPGPYKTRHAIRIDSRPDIQQLLQEISSGLLVTLRPPHEYEDELQSLITK